MLIQLLRQAPGILLDHMVHMGKSNIDVAAGYNSEDYPGLDGYTNRGPGIDIVGLGANTYTAYQSSFYGSLDGACSLELVVLHQQL